MQNLTFGILIGATLAGSFQSAFSQADRSLNLLEQNTTRLSARQERLGQIMAQSLARPHANIGRLQQQYQRLGSLIDQTRQSQERLNRAMNVSQAVSNLQTSARAGMVQETTNLAMVGAGVGYAVKKSATFEDQLIDSQITAGWSVTERIRIGEMVRASALQFNQATEDINRGIGVLVAGGLGAVQDIEILAPKMTKAVTATRSSWEDLGAMTVAMKDNLGISAKDWDKSVNMLIASSKAGQFEVKDMAKWLPSLTPYYQALGVQGEQAVAEIGASLQIARKGAGTSDEAANNMRNFLSKLTAPDTIKDFDKAGIDLKQSMQSLVANGMTPMQAMFSTIEQYVGTKSPKALAEFTKAMSIKDDKERQMAVDRLNETYKLGELFQDQQAMSFIRPMLGNKQEFANIQNTMQQGGNQDLVGQDYTTRMGSSVEQYKSLKIFADDLAMTLGDILKPALLDIVNAVKPAIASFANWAKQNPKIVSGFIGLVAGIIGAKLAFFTLSFVVMSVISPFAKLFVVFRQMQSAVVFLRGLAVLGRFAPMATRFATAIRMIGMAFTVLRTVLMANPIGLAVGLLVIGAVLIYKHWTPIKAFFMNLWANLKAFANSGVANILKTIASFSPLGLFIRAWSAVFGYFKGLGAKFAGFGRDIIQGLINGVTAKFGELKAKMSEMASSVAGAFKGVLGIRSPSRVFMGFGANIAEGVAIGIDGKTSQAVQATQSMANQVAGSFAPNIKPPPPMPKANEQSNLYQPIIATNKTPIDTRQLATGSFDISNIKPPKNLLKASEKTGSPLTTNNTPIDNNIDMGRRLAQTSKSHQRLDKQSLNKNSQSFVIHFSPNIQVSSDNKDAQSQGQQIAALSVQELEKLLARVEANRNRRAFG